MKQSTTYTFQYGSDSDSIDLNTLLLSQIHFSTVLNEIKNEFAKDANLSIKIKPLEKGSVPFDIILDLTWVETLLNFGGLVIDYSDKIIASLLGIMEIRRRLKGKKPHKIELKKDKVIVTIDDTSIEVDAEIYKLYENNAVIDQAIKKGFEAINKDEDVTEVKILDNKKTVLLDIPRQEFVDFTEPNEIYEERTVKEEPKQESLTIFKLVFDKGYKWQFYLKGRKISAYVKDNSFMDRIDRGEQFSKGDTLVAEVEVEKIYDPNMDIYIYNKYTVTKVLQHIPRPQQTNLFEDDK